MNEKLSEALEVCLNALETGADQGSVLKLFPDMTEELRPLLEASIGARSMATRQVPADVIRHGRARVLQHAAEMREAGQKSRRSGIAFRRFATALALASVFFLSGTGLVGASNGALPGDNLYSVKRTWEDVQLVLTINPDNRKELENEFEKERLEEVDELLTEGRHETIAFGGVVTQQDGDLWLVSGILVQIVPASQLPVETVGVGQSISVEGHTNAQGFVEADRIEILDVGFLSPTKPVEMEDGKLEAERHDSHESEDAQDEGNEEGSSLGDAIDGENSSDGGDSISSDSERKDKGDESEDSSSDSNGDDSDSEKSDD